MNEMGVCTFKLVENVHFYETEPRNDSWGQKPDLVVAVIPGAVLSGFEPIYRQICLQILPIAPFDDALSILM